MAIISLVLICLVLIVVAIFLITSLTGAPYVPTLGKYFDREIDKLYKFSRKDLVLDLGAGDGIVLDIVSKRGAKAVGIELNPILATIIRFRFRNNPRVTAVCKNFYRYQFPDETTVIYAFAVGNHIEPIYRKIKAEATRLGKPLYFISNAFNIKELKPEKKVWTWYLYKIKPEKN